MTPSEALSQFQILVGKKHRRYFKRLFSAQQTMSICFVFDATGSMSPFFKGLQRCLREIIGTLQAGMKQLKFK